MKRLFKKCFCSTGIVVGLMFCAPPASAVYTITMSETGGNVMATGSGTVNTAGLTAGGTGFCVAAIVPSATSVCTGAGPIRAYSSVVIPPSFGTGLTSSASSTSGDAAGIGGGNNVYLPIAYVSGSPLNSAATWNSQTFASLGITPGTYTVSFGSGPNAESIVLQIGAASPPVTAPIPSNVNLPGAAGIASQLTVLDLSTGSGPNMTTCLANALQQVFGSSASYLGQSSNGAARIAVGTQTISFYPIAASTSTTQGIGVFLNGDNTINVGTSCGNFTVVPAIANMADLGAALTAMGLNAQIDTKGIFTATVAGGLYAVRADYFVTKGTATGTPSLAFGSDGLLRLTDRDGNVQILRAAFLDTSALQSALATALGGVVTTQADGSAVFTRINGTSMALAPEMVLTPASQVQGSGSLVNDRANHYLYRIANFYQGFAANAR